MPLPQVIDYGTFPIVESVRETTTGPAQYDRLQIVYVSDGSSFSPAPYLPAGSQLVAEQSDKEDLGQGLFKITADYIGLIVESDPKALRRVSAFGQEVSVGPVTYETEEVVGIDTDGDGAADDTARELIDALRQLVTPTGIGDRWNIGEGVLSVVDTYFTTTPPNTALIKTNVMPPNPPPTPPFLWGSYADPLRFNHPAGWILENREYENAFGTIYLVTDTFAFKHQSVPD